MFDVRLLIARARKARWTRIAEEAENLLAEMRRTDEVRTMAFLQDWLKSLTERFRQ